MHDGWIEAFEMADLQDPFGAGRDNRQVMRLGQGRRHRLLDQHVNPVFQQIARDRMMGHSRHGDGGEVGAALERAMIAQRNGIDLLRELRSPLSFGIDHKREFDTGQRRVFVGMQRTETPRTNDRDP